MRRHDAHPHGHLSDFQPAEPVNATRTQRAMPPDCIDDDAFAFGYRKRLEGLVVESSDGPAFVDVAHAAFEGSESTGGVECEGSSHARGVDRLLRELECVHPPATGGMKTTSSPSASAWSQSLNDALTATLSWEAGRRKW